MHSLRLDGRTLTVVAAGRTVSIDLSKAVRARMWDCVLTRPFLVDSFEVRGRFPTADGLRVSLWNQENGLLIPLIFRPEETGLRVTLPAAEIAEVWGINRKIMAVDVLPELMASRVGDEGFFLLPCFSGTLVRFRDHAPTVNSDRIYMEQGEWEKLNLMNCFGMNLAGKGTLAVVHRGDFNCLVTTELNQGGANRIYASFSLRKSETQPIKRRDKEILFRFMEGSDAEYQGMAAAYREYLLRERGVSPLKERVEDNPVLKYSTEAMRTKIFHGLKPFSIDGNVPMTSYTTFAETELILDRMKEAGIARAVITLVGWNLGGHDGAYPTRFPVEPALGGEEGLRRLIAKALDMEYQIVPHDNMTDIYRSAPDFDYEYATRDATGAPRVVGIWGGGQSFKACPVVYLDRWGADIARVKDLGFAGHYYVDAQSTVLWTCSSPLHPADEEEYAIAQSRLTQVPRALYGAVSTEICPAYNLPFIDEVATIHGANNCQYMAARIPGGFKDIIDRIVPFYHIAVHGLITYQESWVHGYRRERGGALKGLLRALACGARPSMEVSMRGGANGDVYSDSIRDVLPAYRIAFDELRDVHVETIETIEELGPEAARITYANGCSFAANWGELPVGDLQPMQYRITRD